MLSILLSLFLAVSGSPRAELASGNHLLSSPERGDAGGIVSLRLTPEVADLDRLRALLHGTAGAALLEDLALVRRNRLGVYDLRVAADASAAARAVQLAKLPGIEWATAPGFGTWLDTPDDPSYAQQWQLSNAGGPGALAGADVAAEAAWSVTTGEPGVIIAILDSGVEITHTDLAPNVWHNALDLPNGIDDDGNGLVDDHDGWDFFNDDADVTGPVSHGTMVAGMAGARANDGFGCAGLAGGWETQAGCRLLCVGVGDSFPDASVVDDGILYAIDQGARVINLSLSLSANPALDLALSDAAANGVLVVCASGNSGSFVTYPASNADTMAVAATSADDSVPSFSSRGPEVEIAAPGDQVLTTEAGNTVTVGSGTSFAAPLVSAAAGLLFSHMPGLTADEARAILTSTALDIDSPGVDDRSGAGRLDAGAALALLDASDCNGNGLFDPTEIANGLASDEDGDGVPDLCQLGTPFCFGDESSTVACPCGNTGPAGAGCANSTGVGARLSASGSASAMDGDLVLHVSGATSGQPGVFLQGRTAVQFPFKDGLLCAGNPTARIEVIFLSATGSGSSSIDVSSVGQVAAGETAYYQFWYRDPAVSTCGTGSNFSSAFEIEWL